jgi:TPR repeat protein
LPSLYINPRSEQPVPLFKSNLGLSYEEGRGVRKSNTKALKYYGKACDLELALKNLTALKSSCLTPLPSSYENPRLEQPLPSFKSHAFW